MPSKLSAAILILAFLQNLPSWAQHCSTQSGELARSVDKECYSPQEAKKAKEKAEAEQKERDYYEKITGLPHPNDPAYYDKMMGRRGKEDNNSSSSSSNYSPPESSRDSSSQITYIYGSASPRANPEPAMSQAIRFYHVEPKYRLLRQFEPEIKMTLLWRQKPESAPEYTFVPAQTTGVLLKISDPKSEPPPPKKGTKKKKDPGLKLIASLPLTELAPLRPQTLEPAL